MKLPRWMMVGMIAVSVLVVLVAGSSWLTRWREHNTSHWQFLNATSGADRVVVCAPSPSRPAEYTERVLEVKDADAVRDLLAKVQWREPGRGFSFCGCRGDYHISFHRQEKLCVTLGWHHGKWVRWHKTDWMTDFELTEDSREAIARWFVNHGFTGIQATVTASGDSPQKLN